MVGDEEECVYPLGSPVPRKEFFMKIYVAFGIYAWVGLVGFEFDGAVDVIIVEGFEVTSIAEDTKCGIPAVNVPVLMGHQGQRTGTWRGGGFSLVGRVGCLCRCI